jgi:hypothetical protein
MHNSNSPNPFYNSFFLLNQTVFGLNKLKVNVPSIANATSKFMFMCV